MKEIIILVCSVLLGTAIFGMINGDRDSIKSEANDLWAKQLEIQSTIFEKEGVQ